MAEALDYRSPVADLPRRRVTVGSIVLGMICGAGAMIAGGFVFLVANRDYTPMKSPPSYMTNKIDWARPLIVAVTLLVGLSVTMWWSYRRRNVGFVAGAIIGAGVAALIDWIWIVNAL
jgi:hypothetical protein